jgi:two-component system sensor histidine kinase MprB
MSLRWRIALALGLISALLGSVSVVASRTLVENSQRGEVEELLDTRAQLFLADSAERLAANERFSRPGRNGGRGSFPGAFESITLCQLMILGRQSDVLAGVDIVAVVDRTGREVCQGVDQAVEDDLSSGRPELLADFDDDELQTPGFVTTTVGGTDYLHRVVLADNGTTVVLSRSLTESQAVVARVTSQMVVLTLVAVVAAMVAGWFIARQVVRPVERLRVATEHIAGTEDLSVPVSVDGGGEVASLAASFNTMLGALKTSKEQQRRLVMDASHELRTPLTSLRTNVEMLNRHPHIEPDARTEMLDDVDFELRELTDLVEELVDLATDTELATELLTEVRLVDLVRPIAERTTRRTGREVVVIDEGSALLAVRVGQIERVLSNLCDNAVKYSPEDAPVTIRVVGNRVEVADRGVGIAPGERELVFQRFYRADTARTRKGSGLGLAIVARNVAAHGGQVWVQDNPGGGSVFVVELPAEPPRPAGDSATP